ncbi:hypothetical protein [Flammeovirga kamogawensis]|uniref:Uncharacterized protein n=1 Tax=Flammeovirga kamogawensis TaxID=373891 RepID=A0ABX8GSX1_9BACT|nr:hypothetical protein [Flammeovirga kamogawensis]MBB6462732.1 putative nucleic-acid-binding Zn-ribbon protein [Flammeovirga kamogawensis]QWG06035.1 hypothetical protein KM029_11750 [Flammeovirga kamogawensis]TRX67867.1 hypothetical protein EO216_06770 [Flammeovirga kamogawensis]
MTYEGLLIIVLCIMIVVTVIKNSNFTLPTKNDPLVLEYSGSKKIFSVEKIIRNKLVLKNKDCGYAELYTVDNKPVLIQNGIAFLVDSIE